MRRQSRMIDVLGCHHMVKLGDLPEVGAFKDIVPRDMMVEVPLHHPVHVPVYLQAQPLLGAALSDRKLDAAVQRPSEGASLVVRTGRNHDSPV